MHIVELPVRKGKLVCWIHERAPYNPSLRRPFILVVPGGGYHDLASREGEPVASHFFGAGYHVGMLSYSVAPSRFPTQLVELSLAVSEIRSHADEWMVMPGAIIVCGFSAGGHLTASLGCFWDKPWLDEMTGTTKEQRAPNGLILGYPVITSGEFAHKGSFTNLLGEKEMDPKLRDFVSLEKQVGPGMPPLFLWHTWADQGVPVENSLLFALALKRQGICCELHVYPEGPHGMALADRQSVSERHPEEDPYIATWTRLANNWLEKFYPFQLKEEQV